MLKQFLIILTCMALCFSCISCQKEEASPLAGTAWECLGKGDILVFNDNHSGSYYCKSAHDDVYDEVFSSFDFMYSISGQEISIRVYFTKRVFILDGKIEDDVFMTNGTHIQLHFKKIQHKAPEQQ